MDELGIVSIKVGKDNDTKVKANEKIPLVFIFTRPLKEGETVEVECHLHEKQFDLHKTYGTFTLSSKPQEKCTWITQNQSSSCSSDPVYITLPEELAGAAVNIYFSMKSDPSNWLKNIYSLLRYKTITVEILSSEGGPKIEALHWSDTKEIKFGTLSPARTDALLKKETVYLHIHTRGMYGKMVQCMCNADAIATPRTENMKNNVAVLEYQFFNDRINKIEIECYPFTPYTSSMKKVSIPYIKDEEVELSTKTMPVLSLPNAPKKNDYASEAKCRVDFRPKTDYDGSFGFSWYRIGDMNSSTGYTQTSRTDSRTKQTFDVNRPCNDQPFSERDFAGEGILGRHYETASRLLFWKRDRIVANGNNSGTGTGVNYPKAGVRDNFIADTTMADDHKKDYPKISLLGGTDAEPFLKEYLTPVVTLVEGKTIELQLFLYVKETPKEILFVFDNPRVETDGVLTINVKPAEINSPAVTTGTRPTPNFAYTIEITCSKKFDKEVRLKAYAVPDAAKEGMVKKENGRLKMYPQEGSPLVLPELCGMLRFLPNDDAHWRKIDVVFFNVKTNLAKDPEPIGGLKIPTIEVGPLTSGSGEVPIPMRPPEPAPPVVPAFPLPTTGDTPFSFPKFPLPPPPPPKPIVIELPPVQVGNLNEFLAQAYVEAYVVVEDIDLNGNADYEKMCVDINSDGIPDGFDYKNWSNLTALLKNHPLYKEYDAKKYFCFFFMPDRAYVMRSGVVSGGINGYSVPNGNFTICFNGARKETPVHELGHTLGLPHTFDGNTDQGAKYTYEDGKTDNIMDYSHSFGIGINRQSFFHWQWETLNTNLNK